jgi:hypothetical protein
MPPAYVPKPAKTHLARALRVVDKELGRLVRASATTESLARYAGLLLKVAEVEAREAAAADAAASGMSEEDLLKMVLSTARKNPALRQLALDILNQEDPTCSQTDDSASLASDPTTSEP